MLSQTGKDKKGFTLIELMIVVAIIGILAAIAIPQFAKMREKAHDASAQSALANLRTAQETYYLENDRYMSITDNYQEWYEPEENLRLNIVRVTEGTVDVGWTASASYKGSSSKFVYDSRTGKMDKKDIDAIEDEEEDGEEDT